MQWMKWRAIVLAVVLGATVVTALTLGTVKPAQAVPCLNDWTASGCTYYNNYTYVRGGCRFFVGWTCYYCEYTCTDGSFDQCGENQAGTYQMCRKCASSGCEPFVESPMP